jgi:beta-1,4-mannosyl-glycoprotein beta-1,4-N-acetylglucosaminyltransferase
MLVDCFPYFNEKELLELRINVLKDYVDGFIIADADRTHRGEPKEFTCQSTVNQLGLPEELIEVLRVSLPSAEEVADPWFRERGQRDALATALKLFPEDTVFICSDCDEIPNPEKLLEAQEYLKEHNDQILGLNMSMHYGRADMQLCSPTGELFKWPCATICTVKALKKYGSITSVRSQPNRKFLGTLDGGWHFSWMGDVAARKLKLRSIAEYYLWDTEEVRERCEEFEPIEGTVDMLGRQDHLLTSFPVEDLPPEAVKLERVKSYLLPYG